MVSSARNFLRTIFAAAGAVAGGLYTAFAASFFAQGETAVVGFALGGMLIGAVLGGLVASLLFRIALIAAIVIAVVFRDPITQTIVGTVSGYS